MSFVAKAKSLITSSAKGFAAIAAQPVARPALQCTTAAKAAITFTTRMEPIDGA